jgi:hypothetical protein
VDTDIATMKQSNEWPADIYDLSGRLVRRGATSLHGLHQGTYIINQKKVTIK